MHFHLVFLFYSRHNACVQLAAFGDDHPVSIAIDRLQMHAMKTLSYSQNKLCWPLIGTSSNAVGDCKKRAILHDACQSDLGRYELRGRWSRQLVDGQT